MGKWFSHFWSEILLSQDGNWFFGHHFVIVYPIFDFFAVLFQGKIPLGKWFSHFWSEISLSQDDNWFFGRHFVIVYPIFDFFAVFWFFWIT